MSEKRTIQPKTPGEKSNGTEIPGKKFRKFGFSFSRNSVNCCSIHHGNVNRHFWSNEKHPTFENFSSEISVPLNLPEFTVDAWFTLRKFNNVQIFSEFFLENSVQFAFRTFQLLVEQKALYVCRGGFVPPRMGVFRGDFHFFTIKYQNKFKPWF